MVFGLLFPMCEHLKSGCRVQWEKAWIMCPLNFPKPNKWKPSSSSITNGAPSNNNSQNNSKSSKSSGVDSPLANTRGIVLFLETRSCASNI